MLFLIERVSMLVRGSEDEGMQGSLLLLAKVLYDGDVVEEEGLLEWARGLGDRGPDFKDYCEQLAPMVKWLEEAEEETDDDESD